MSDEVAKVSPISDDIPWSAKASAADAMQRVTHETPFIAIWMEPNGNLSWSSANINTQMTSLFAMLLAELVQQNLRKKVS